MSDRALYDAVCIAASRRTTTSYSTSFSLGVRMLDARFRDPIHAIYGFVRFADEIVDTFHDQPQGELLSRFRADTEQAIRDGFSINPILHSFQQVVRRYGIEWELIGTFLDSMAMDLQRTSHDEASFDRYVLGSAEVVGLMCLRVFTEGDNELFERLKPYAMSLGSAFQKVNFLRDLKQDCQDLGRVYFPGVDISELGPEQKSVIESGIQSELDYALEGIRLLPAGARFGVHLAYLYYRALFNKIRKIPAEELMRRRVRVRDRRKIQLLLGTFVQHRLNLI